MTKTVTIRADETLCAALEERARIRGTSVSAVAREILRDALEERPLAHRAGHLRGCLALPKKGSEQWRRTLKERNWRA